MEDCPLVLLAKNRRLLKKLNESGRVSIPEAEWMWFFHALAFLNQESEPHKIFCMIQDRHMVISKTPIPRESRRNSVQTDLFET